MKALEPLEIVSSRNDGPYAYRRKLGRCIVGAIVNKSSNKSVKCHCIAVKAVISGKVASHHSKINNKLQRSETGLKEMFERMFHNDFHEVKQLLLETLKRYPEKIQNSSRFWKQEPRKVVTIMKCYCHSNVKLPNDTDVKLPNNRNQAVRRINQPKRRIRKDSNFFEKNIGEFLEKGYARKSERKANHGGLCYLPHHGVRHPSKPGKVRIVFDCSVNFAGACLNNKLLSGPDLINQLAGVLLCLR